MTTPTFDLTPFIRRDEGQHFDCRSMVEAEDGNIVLQQAEPLPDFGTEGPRV